MRNLIIGVLATLAIYLPNLSVGQALNDTFNTLVDEQGQISLPEGFRLHWVHLGSWIVVDENAPGHGFHDVYAQLEAVTGYLDTGRFPDGSVLVKEIRSVASGALTTGRGQWARDKVMWFVMVKDDQQRFTGPNWAQGWGWALFQADAPQTNVSQGFVESCRSCHLPVEDSDWVFVDGYPTLLSPD